jgi:Putative esterase
MGSSGRAISRRAVLLGSVAATVGAGGLAVEQGILPGRHWLSSSLGTARAEAGLPRGPGGRTVSGQFHSAKLGRSCGYTIGYPTNRADRLPVVVVLHAHGADHRTAFDTLGMDRFLRAAGYRFALASVDGGDHCYWHHRADGTDAGAMVIEEFLPLLAAHGLDTRRIGLFGWSMGGFGALWLAGVLGARRVAAAAALSPALWHRAADTAPGAFDDPADFAAHDVFHHVEALTGIGVRIDCGTADGFYPTARDYLGVLRAQLRPPPAGGFEPGGHTATYWRQTVPTQLAFLASQLR